MPLFQRPTEHDIEHGGSTLRMRRASASTGLRRESIARAIVDAAKGGPGITVEQLEQCIQDIARHIQTIDGTPASEILGEDPRAVVDALLTAADVIGLWVQWYHASQIDEDLRGKSLES